MTTTETYIIPKEQIDNAIQALREIQKDDDEQQAHIDADTILLNLLPIEIVKEYNKVEKWYS